MTGTTAPVRRVLAKAPAAALLLAAGLAYAAPPLPGGVACAETTFGEVAPEATILRHDRTVTATGPAAYRFDEELVVRVEHRGAAESFRQHSLYVDDGYEVLRLEGELAEPGAKPYRSRKRDVYETAANDGFSIALSGRVAHLRLPLATRYPATYTLRASYAVAEGVYVPVVDFAYAPGVAVESATLTVVDPAGELLTRVVDPRGRLRASGSRARREYRAAGLAAREGEDFVAPAQLAGPAVLLAPRRARLEGSRGDFGSWGGMGAWTAGLLADAGPLPEAAAAEVRALVRDTGDPLERVRRVYAYMQARTHYVSIQLGLGGFRPMSPAQVHELGYGDCKALSNYTRLLLEAVGVPSRYCVIGVGDREIAYPEFASVNQANHAMLAVPVDADTLWLECTSQLVPAGYIGPSASGRRALLVDAAAGTGSLVRSSGAPAEAHVRASRTRLTVEPTGDAHLLRRTRLTGDAYEEAHLLTHSPTAAARRRFPRRLAQEGPRSSLEREAYGPDGRPEATILDEVTLPRYARDVAGRLVIPLAATLALPDFPARLRDRERDLRLGTHGVWRDTIEFVVPAGMELAKRMAPVRLEGPQGRYELSVAPTSDGLRVERRLELRRGLYPAAGAAALADFYEAVERAQASVATMRPARADGP